MNDEEYITIKVEALLDLLKLGDRMCDHSISRHQLELAEIEWRARSEAMRKVINMIVRDRNHWQGNTGSR